MKLFALWISLLVFASGSLGCPEEERLLHFLLRDREAYMPFSRPTFNVSHKLMLIYDAALEDLEIDEERYFMDAKLRLKMIWTDEFFVWDPTDFDGLDVIRVPINLLWRPDIKLDNSFGNDMNIDQSVMAVVGNTGGVLWLPSATTRTRCSKLEGAWECYFKFLSSTYNGRHLDLHLYGSRSDMDTSDFEEGRWRIVKSSRAKHAKQYPCCPEVYPEITYNMTISKNFYM